MGRAPCCEKMGLKKGPWSPEEDEILTSYIHRHGHGNWRALPKQAGLLRCGKSCRLRWINYLKPDIKRGNFTGEEEETIIQLHQSLGNKWSAIAAKLPGRTDNEIKNVWHTHLKKRLLDNSSGRTEDGPKARKRRRVVATDGTSVRIPNHNESESVVVDAVPNNNNNIPPAPREPSSPQLSNSDISSVTTTAATTTTATTTTTTSSSANDLEGIDDAMGYFEDISGFLDEGFYLSGGDHIHNPHAMHLQEEDSMVYNFGNNDGGVVMDHMVLQGTDESFYGFQDHHHQPNADCGGGGGHDDDDNMDFWLNVFTKAGDLSDLLQI